MQFNLFAIAFATKIDSTGVKKATPASWNWPTWEVFIPGQTERCDSGAARVKSACPSASPLIQWRCLERVHSWKATIVLTRTLPRKVDPSNQRGIGGAPYLPILRASIWPTCSAFLVLVYFQFSLFFCSFFPFCSVFFFLFFLFALPLLGQYNVSGCATPAITRFLLRFLCSIIF